MEGTKKVVEINGVKMEIDLSTARVIDEYRVGDNVKVLRKTYNGYEVLPGVITEFVNFESLPTIVIAVYKWQIYTSDIEFIYFNANTEGIEITPALEHEINLNRDSVVERFKDEIKKKRAEADELEAKLHWFNKYFNKYFSKEENA